MATEIPKATHRGVLRIGDMKIPCAVLDNGKRVLSETGITEVLGSRSGGSKLRKYAQQDGGAFLPLFLAPINLKSFIDKDLMTGHLNPIPYQDGKKVTYGFEASLLPTVCDIWLKAREAGVLYARQLDKAQKAEILMRGLAHVGIIALVDEATGYQAERDRNELHQLLERFISKELLPWAKRFPDEFYQEMFRLMGWQFHHPSVKRPILVGKLTNQAVYKKLPPGVLDELKLVNPPDDKGRRKHKYHQYLTEDVGHPYLEKHFIAVIALMKAASTWSGFIKLLDRVFPEKNQPLQVFDEVE